MATSTTGRQPAGAASAHMVVLGQPTKPLYYTVAGDDAHRPCRETERRWATSQDGWVMTYDPVTLATVLCNPDAAASNAGRKIVLPSFGKTPPAANASCTLSGEPTDDGGFTVVVVEPPNGSVLWYCHVGSSTTLSAAWEKVKYDVDTLLG